jgi:tellurite resistance protein TerC
MTGALSWILFNIGVIVMLVLDLKVFHKEAHEVKFKEAIGFSIFWILLALLFAAFIHHWHGPAASMEFIAGYLIEKSLSVDNLFVFIMIFNFFHIPPRLQHTILFWGILGALIMRAMFIIVGVALIQKFSWIIYIFGGFLIYTGFKMAFKAESQIDPEKNPVFRLAQRFLPITTQHVDDKFMVKIDGKRFFTPLFIVLLVVEASDLVFAVDSIPAILAISKDPFIVYTSNVFAILGLRALYFALAGLINIFHYLKYGLACILVFVGAKMIVSHFVAIPIAVALGAVALILAASIGASLLFPQKPEERK